jgi:hypothetical protein
MHTTALKLPVTVPPWQKPTSVIRVLRRPRPVPTRVSAPVMSRPESKWTVVGAIVLAVICHIVPVAIVEMKADRTPAEITQAVKNNSISTTAVQR